MGIRNMGLATENFGSVWLTPYGFFWLDVASEGRGVSLP